MIVEKESEFFELLLQIGFLYFRVPNWSATFDIQDFYEVNKFAEQFWFCLFEKKNFFSVAAKSMLNSECSELGQGIFYATDRFLSFPDKIRFVQINVLQPRVEFFVEFRYKMVHISCFGREFSVSGIKKAWDIQLYPRLRLWRSLYTNKLKPTLVGAQAFTNLFLCTQIFNRQISGVRIIANAMIICNANVATIDELF